MPPAKRTRTKKLTVAVTGPTGPCGFGLIPLLQAEDQVGRIVGIARRPFDPAEHGWTKMEYRRGDVRDPAALETAFAGADVDVDLARRATRRGPGDRERQVHHDAESRASPRSRRCATTLRRR